LPERFIFYRKHFFHQNFEPKLPGFLVKMVVF